MSKEEMQAIKDAVIEEYKEMMVPSSEEETIYICFLKLKKTFEEINQTKHWFDNSDMGKEEALIRLDVLLGAMKGIHNDIKNAISSTEDK